MEEIEVIKEKLGSAVGEHEELYQRIDALEKRMAEKDTQFAVINTKLSAILWGIGVIGTAIIGFLIKMMLG